MSKTTLILFYGGASTEHEVSKRSAAYFIKNLDYNKYDLACVGIDKDGQWYGQQTTEIKKNTTTTVPIYQDSTPLSFDLKSLLQALSKINNFNYNQSSVVALPILHGSGGEDGSIQGVFTNMNIPYISADTKSSSVCMDKEFTKLLCQAHNVPTVDHVCFTQYQWESNKQLLVENIKSKLSFPCFVKPANLGSSVGITKVKKIEELADAIKLGFKYDEKILVESFIDAREIEFAVMGFGHPQISGAGEVIVEAAEFYDYEAKYISDNAAKVVIPANITSTQLEQAKELIKLIWRAVDLSGFARIDFFLCKKTSKFYLNEINTIPGFTSISQFPLLWQEAGKSPSQIIDDLVDFAIRRQKSRCNLQRDFLKHD